MYNPNLHFHFIGIGGSGMSGLAEVLLNLGFRISGSDLKDSAICQRLARLGAKITFGHFADNIPEACSLVVRSSAVRMDNPEVLTANERALPIVPRAEVLAELMRLKYGVAVAGSHGKTTTTSMIGEVLEKGGLDPTLIIGGQVQATGSGGRLGRGEFLVAETDESDRSFLLLKPTVAVVTNIDSEHLEAYGSFQELEECFEQFICAVPFYGLAVLCVDDPNVRKLSARYHRRKTTYGLCADADIQARNLIFKRTSTSFELTRLNGELGLVELPMLGRHMVANCLAAIAVGLEFGVPLEKITQALSAFSGVKRRLEVVAQVDGITLMNDYGHHPTEIKATLAAIRANYTEIGKLRVIFQPHRYSRTRDCFSEFVTAFQNCDELVVTEIYGAGENPIEGIDGQSLFEAIDHPAKRYITQLEEIPSYINSTHGINDVVLCLGAGSIGMLPEEILRRLG